MPTNAVLTNPVDTVPAAFDHLMYGGGLALDALTADVAQRCGITAAFGGRHDTGGTHNALLGLGGARYLELIARDPDGDAGAARGQLVAGLPAPRMIAWAVAVDDLEGTVARARAHGYDPGPIEPLRRRRPDGTWLSWRLCWQGEGVFLGVVPFLIEWGDCPHPAVSAPSGCRLRQLRAEHPRPDAVQRALDALAVDVTADPGPAPALVATFETPVGPVELR